MNEINWLTADYVKTEAEKGLKEALAVTKLHWLQMSEATLEQLEAEFKDTRTLDSYTSTSYCGLCQYMKLTKKRVCPLNRNCSRGNMICCSEYRKVDKTFGVYKSIAEIYPDFHEKSGILYEKIKGLNNDPETNNPQN